MSDSPVWLVTGASKGIGLEVVKAALASGARVAATTRNPEMLTAELDDPNLLPLPMRVTDEVDVRRAVARVEQELGPIDVLVNNAGYSLLGAVEEVALDDVRADGTQKVVAICPFSDSSAGPSLLIDAMICARPSAS